MRVPDTYSYSCLLAFRGRQGGARVPENKSGRGFEGNKEGKYLTICPSGTKAPQSNYDIDLLAFDYA